MPERSNESIDLRPGHAGRMATPLFAGPFHNAYKSFRKGGAIPLVIGAFGEPNDEFQAESSHGLS